jgi:hypothetical protein
LGHLEQKFWKISKEPTSFAIFLEVVVDDEVTTLFPLASFLYKPKRRYVG